MPFSTECEVIGFRRMVWEIFVPLSSEINAINVENIFNNYNHYYKYNEGACALNAWANKGCEIYVICEIRGYTSACIPWSYFIHKNIL